MAKNDGRHLEVFAIGSDEALWHIWKVSPGALGAVEQSIHKRVQTDGRSGNALLSHDAMVSVSSGLKSRA